MNNEEINKNKYVKGTKSILRHFSNYLEEMKAVKKCLLDAGVQEDSESFKEAYKQIEDQAWAYMSVSIMDVQRGLLAEDIFDDNEEEYEGYF